MRCFSFVGVVGLLATGDPAHGQAPLRAGYYVETPPPGTISWIGQAVRLRSDSTFAYQRWSDDLSSGRYGSGTYRVVGRQLQLLFAAPVPRVSHASMRPLPNRPDSLTLVFRVEAADTIRGVEAVPFATVMAYGESGAVLATSAANEAGRATIRLAHAQQPVLLRVTSLGMQTWQESVPAASTAYRVRLIPNSGTPYPAGTVRTLQVRQHKGQAVLRDADSPHPLRLQPDK